MDSFWLEAAFFQASRVIGITGKNPAVGCILVKNDEIIALGATSKGGRPHAEENAIEMAGNNVKDCTMYLTLEPCNITNNQKSCTKLIIAAGIKKVVIGMLDPNPSTYKKGLNELIKNNIEVEVKKISLNNFLLNYSHYCYFIYKRPLVALKLGTSLDGKITNEEDKSQWITSKFARSHVQQIRSIYDSVLVGTNTLVKDNPLLTCRIDGFKKSSNRIVFDKNLKIDLNCKLLKTLKKNPLYIVTNKDKNNIKYKKLSKLGVNLYSVGLSNNYNLNILETMNFIFQSNIKSILVEGGAKTASEFLNNDMVDLIYIYRSNSIIGSKSLNMFGETKYNKNFLLFNEVNLESEKFEVWIHKKIKNYNRFK